jgi:hypothetical protein
VRLGPIPGSGGLQWYADMTRNNSILPSGGNYDLVGVFIAIQAVCIPNTSAGPRASSIRTGDPATIAVRPAFPWDQT